MRTEAARALIAERMDEDTELLPNVLGLLHAHRWRLRFHDYDSVRNAAGFPDVVAIRGDVLLVAELKSQRGQVRPKQREWIAGFTAVAAATQHVRVYVWRPIDLLDGTILAAVR